MHEYAACCEEFVGSQLLKILNHLSKPLFRAFFFMFPHQDLYFDYHDSSNMLNDLSGILDFLHHI